MRRRAGGPSADPGWSSVAVPVAVDAGGRLARPEKADPGESYRCPGCGSEVVLRSGDKRRAHFAHRKGESCSPDGVLHRSAKMRLVEVLDAWIDGSGPRPCISRDCRRHGCDGGVVQDLPGGITQVRAEMRLPSGRIGDVVLLRDGVPVAVVEVLATSRVGEVKSSALRIPWVELRARDILDRPYWWVAVQDGLLPFDCPRCADRRSAADSKRERIRRAAEVVATRLGVALPPSPPYEAAPHRCWRCREEILVYSWPGGGRHSVRKPPAPVPDSVQHRVTDGAGDYWANCCSECSAVQGDYHLIEGSSDFRFIREVVQNPDYHAEAWLPRSHADP